VTDRIELSRIEGDNWKKSIQIDFFIGSFLISVNLSEKKMPINVSTVIGISKGSKIFFLRLSMHYNLYTFKTYYIDFIHNFYPVPVLKIRQAYVGVIFFMFAIYSIKSEKCCFIIGWILSAFPPICTSQ